MIIPDWMIREYVYDGTIGITPFDPSNVQPASVDVLLDNQMVWFENNIRYIDVKEDVRDVMSWRSFDSFMLPARSFALGSTVERISLPNNIVGRIEGKSSLARLGLMIHSTAGFIDPGFNGTVTLELYNLNDFAIKLYAGMKIGQISFSEMLKPCERPYGTNNNKYNGQSGPTPSKYFENF